MLPNIAKSKADAHGRVKSDGFDRESTCASAVSEIVRTRTLGAVHLRFGFEAAMMIPLAIRSGQDC